MLAPDFCEQTILLLDLCDFSRSEIPNFYGFGEDYCLILLAGDFEPAPMICPLLETDE